MTSPVFENLADFFDTDEFAVEAVFDGGSPVEVMLDRDFYLEGEATIGIEGDSPRIMCRSDDIPGVDHGSTCEAAGFSFIVRGIQPGGDGLTILRLEEV